MTKDTFLTISTISEGVYKEKGSKFLAFAISVSCLDEIKRILAEKRKEFHDARHICFAYILGAEGNDTRANDDGEPSGTAGRPILGILQSNNLTNVLLIVVRYFGGTKLGTSGLINAYKEASANAISNNTIVEKTVDETVSIRFEYPFLNRVLSVVKELTPVVIEQHFDADCFLTLRIRRRDFPVMLSRLEKIESISIVE